MLLMVTVAALLAACPQRMHSDGGIDMTGGADNDGGIDTDGGIASPKRSVSRPFDAGAVRPKPAGTRVARRGEGRL
jgi:hypothetical protein